MAFARSEHSFNVQFVVNEYDVCGHNEWALLETVYHMFDCMLQAFGVSVEELEKYVANGIINWGEPVRNIMEDGALAVNQARTSERTPLVTVLLSGE